MDEKAERISKVPLNWKIVKIDYGNGIRIREKERIERKIANIDQKNYRAAQIEVESGFVGIKKLTKATFFRFLWLVVWLFNGQVFCEHVFLTIHILRHVLDI